jgi:NAD(P)-dependent dehydrogenase (short-subunit alcohol dehydrogenase family)
MDTMDTDDFETCVRVLEQLVSDRAQLARLSKDGRKRLMIAAGRLSQPDRQEKRQFSRANRKQIKQERREADEAKLARTGMRQQRLLPTFVTPEPAARAAAHTQREAWDCEAPELTGRRVCYICKAEILQLHFFYDQLCPQCGDFNYQKRTQTADLSGRVALVSGARVKIGYQAAMLLLRAGARVIVSTRFPRDAALRYSREPDFAAFRERLCIYGLDLRHTPSVEAFARRLSARESRLDFILHNACQTVRRPTGFYAHLMEQELAPLSELAPEVRGLLTDYEDMRRQLVAERAHAAQPVLASAATHAMHAVPQVPQGLVAAPELSQLALLPEDHALGPHLFPEGALDADLQQVDLRAINSWRLPLAHVSTVELIEVQLVNAIAPFVLNARLKPLLMRTPERDKHIVNVSAMEGQFYRRFKTDKHPHTNMAKAALNMMTRTSAVDYVRDGIHMNSVDTGWVTDEDPLEIAQRKIAEHGFHPPLDIVDGAARIVDPIVDGINTGHHVWGQFLKDYRPTTW